MEEELDRSTSCGEALISRPIRAAFGTHGVRRAIVADRANDAELGLWVVSGVHQPTLRAGRSCVPDRPAPSLRSIGLPAGAGARPHLGLRVEGRVKVGEVGQTHVGHNRERLRARVVVRSAQLRASALRTFPDGIRPTPVCALHNL